MADYPSKLPTRCPNCDADLTDDDSIGYQICKHSTVIDYGGGRINDEGDIELPSSAGDLLHSPDNWLSMVMCQSCEHDIPSPENKENDE